MSLKPFTCPWPETRFLHAGKSVYKFKIRYGNISSDGMGENTSLELEEAIRVILGNLDNTHPFTTEHFIIFPYLSKWERVSKLRFKHGGKLLDPAGAEDIHHTSETKSPCRWNPSEDIRFEYQAPEDFKKDGINLSVVGEPVENSAEPNTSENSQWENRMLLLQPVSPSENGGSVASKRRGFLELWKSTLFPPLQRIFGGSN